MTSQNADALAKNFGQNGFLAPNFFYDAPLRCLPLPFIPIRSKSASLLTNPYQGLLNFYGEPSGNGILRPISLPVTLFPFRLYTIELHTYYMYTVSQKKTSHFNFWHNFAICWDIFTIFETPCSGLIAGWCNLLHTHHRCEAFTSHDVTHDVIQAVARSVHWHRISYHLTYGVWTHRT